MSMPAMQLPLGRSIVGPAIVPKRALSLWDWHIALHAAASKLQADISGAKESDLLPEPQIE